MKPYLEWFLLRSQYAIDSFKKSKIILQKRNLKFLPSIFILLLIAAFFQNCGQQGMRTRDLASVDNVRVPVAFDNKKISIDYQSLYKKMNYSYSGTQESLGKLSFADTRKENIPQKSRLVINMNNMCLAGYCEKPEYQNELACQLKSEQYRPELKNTKQAYLWVTTRGYYEVQLMKLISESPVNNDCILGVSQEEKYKLLQSVKLSVNDPEVSGQQYHHQTLNSLEAMGFFQNEFNSNPSQAQVKIGVIDTGVENSHEDLNTKVMQTYNFSSCSGLCHWHGTFVAGIIAGKVNNVRGGIGISNNSVIYSYQVGNASGEISIVELVNALNKAAEDKLDIVNLSLGGSNGFDASYEAAIANLIFNNTLIISAAGNENIDIDKIPRYPAAYNFSGMINVVAASPSKVQNKSWSNQADLIGDTLLKDSYSNYCGSANKICHIAAPGFNIYSTTLNNTYGAASGTSFATPVVTGSIALLKGYLKLKGVSDQTLTPAFLKSQFLAAMPSIKTLEFTNSDSVVISPVKDNKFVDLVALKNKSIELGNLYSENGMSMALSEQDIVVKNSNKFVRIVLNVDKIDPKLGLKVKVYTNRAYLGESYVANIDCQLSQTKNFCEFLIPFEKMLIDPDVYFEVTDGVTVFNTFNIPKTSLNFGSRDEANLLGELVGARLQNLSYRIEGWVCLQGFPDSVEIQIIEDSPAGAVKGKIKTNQQAIGDYYKFCQSPEVNFGFYINLEKYFDLASISTKKIYFKAIHPTKPEKSVILKGYSYQPAYLDPNPAEYVDYFETDRNYHIRPNVKFNLKNYKFVNDNLDLTVDTCITNVYTGHNLKFSIKENDLFYLPYESLTSNPSYMMHLTDQDMSDQITMSSYVGSNGATAASFKNVTVNSNFDAFKSSSLKKTVERYHLPINKIEEFSDIRKLFYFSAKDNVNSNNSIAEKSYIVDIEAQKSSEVDAIMNLSPENWTSDGNCKIKSTVTQSVNLKRYIASVEYSSDSIYNKDKLGLGDNLSDTQLKDFFALKTDAAKKFDFNKFSLNPFSYNLSISSLATENASSYRYDQILLFDDAALLKKLYNGKANYKTLASSGSSNKTCLTYRDFSYPVGYCQFPNNLNTNLLLDYGFIDSLSFSNDLNMNLNAIAPELAVITNANVTTPDLRQYFFVVIDYANVSKMNLNKFILRVTPEGQTSIDYPFEGYSFNSQALGFISAKVQLKSPVQKIKIEILTNNENIFTVNTLKVLPL